MLTFDWDDEKDKALRQERGLGFVELVHLLESGAWLDEIEHPNRAKYPRQRIFVLELFKYVWLVPNVKDGNKIFLKTIIPSRKMTKIYLGVRKDD